jgi:hypothetical protein
MEKIWLIGNLQQDFPDRLFLTNQDVLKTLCEAGVSTLADMRNLNNTITAIRFINNPNHPIRPYCLKPTKLDEYALRPPAS